MKTKRGLFESVCLVGLVVILLSPRAGQAQNYEILHQELDNRRTGITVMRVWGSGYEMGYGKGVALAEDIYKGVEEIKAYAGSNYVTLRYSLSNAAWLPEGTEDEIEGMVAGVKSVLPDAELDDVDIKITNTFGDWGYACRSHSSWGNYADSSFKTISTRRLDFSAPFEVAKHHVLCAWDPEDGSARWVNFSPPGYVAVITAVNEYGTMVSLHDYQSWASTDPGLLPRCMATRLVLTEMEPELPVNEHLSWATQQLGAVQVVTGTFINYYVPEGEAGVFTCPAGGSCGEPRVPRDEFFSGEVIMTTNQQTDGTSAPPDDSFMEAYYLEGGEKDLESHYSLMGHNGLHLMSVGYRGEGDMLIWAEGRDSNGVTDRVEIEWNELFSGENNEDPDAGVSDGGLVHDGSVDGAVVDGDVEEPGNNGGDGGCGCRTLQQGKNGEVAGVWFLLLLGFLLPVLRRSKRSGFC